MITFPIAKINLGLDILERRADGYHNISTVFYPIALKDVLEIIPFNGKDIVLHTSGIPVECPMEKNLIVKAYRLLQLEYQLKPLDIHLYKHIPHGTGLGGGSSDASAMLKMLNEYFELKLSDEQLARYARKIGADCPFFIYNRPLLAGGIGDEFENIDLSLKGYYLVLCMPDVMVPTAAAYSKVIPRMPEMSISQIVKLPMTEWRGLLKNDFEPSVFEQFPIIGDIKNMLYTSGAIYASMSGSGASVYGIYESLENAEEAMKALTDCRKFLLEL